jgi:hypothetical protein
MEPELLDSLKKLMADTEAALVAVHRKRKDIGGAVNWADLSCMWAELTQGWDGHEVHTNFVVTIEEVSPDSIEFQKAIHKELERRGWPGVFVDTEW